MGLSEEMAERQRQAVESLIEAQRSGQIEAVETTLSLLSGQEEEVLRLRYGIGRAQLRTQREIGEAVGSSAGRVGQIEEKAKRRLGWFGRMVGPVGSPAVERYAVKARAERLEEERRKDADARERAVELERRRQDKAERGDARRAKARTKAWQRKLDKAVVDRDALSAAKELLIPRIAQLERRGWLARNILPHASVLARSRAELVALEEKIRDADAAIAKIRSEPPD